MPLGKVKDIQNTRVPFLSSPPPWQQNVGHKALKQKMLNSFFCILNPEVLPHPSKKGFIQLRTVPPGVTKVESQREINDQTGLYLSFILLPAFNYFQLRGFPQLDAVYLIINPQWACLPNSVPLSSRVNVNLLHSYTTVILQTKPLACSWSNVRGEQWEEWVIPVSWLNFCPGMLFSCEAMGNRWKLLLLAQVSHSAPKCKSSF